MDKADSEDGVKSHEVTDDSTKSKASAAAAKAFDSSNSPD
tara:strand:+ start:374 stop:493 length:120 start_codon:yes stop_codon:yes gene_type:complete